MSSVQECQDAAFVLMLHELIHAYQAQQLEHRTGLPVNDRWLRFLCEGHAIEFSRRIAAEHGISLETLAKIYQTPPLPTMADLAQRRAGVLFTFDYVLSARYAAKKCHTINDFAGLLDQKLDYATVLDVVAPHDDRASTIGVPQIPTEGTPDSRSAQDVAETTDDNVPGRAQGLLACCLGRSMFGGYTLAPPLPLDYLDALIYACPAAFVEPKTAAAFQEGVIIDARTPGGTWLEVCVVRCSSVPAAHDLWSKACAQHRTWARGQARNWQPQANVIPGEETYVCRDWPAKGRTMCLLHRGPNMVLGDGDDPEATYAFIDQLLQTILKAESAP
jgi:hypothetical protein